MKNLTFLLCLILICCLPNRGFLNENVSQGDRISNPVFEARAISFTDVESVHLNDLWAYYVDDNSWECIHPTGTPPEPRRCHNAAYDPINQRMIMTAGYDASDTFDQVWALSLKINEESWALAQPTTGTLPGNLWDTEILYSPTLKSIVAFDSVFFPNQLWIWNCETDICKEIPLSGPSGRHYPAMTLDDKRSRILFYGGGTWVVPFVSDELWELDLTPGAEAWNQLPRLGNPPPEKWLLRPVIDPVRDRLILYGGNSHPDFTTGDYKDSTYEMNLASHEWEIVSTHTPPSARGQYGASWDNVRGRMHILGGLYRIGPDLENVITYNEIWTFDSDTQSWFQQLPLPDPDDGIPEIRRMPTAVFDELNRRVILFGGEKICPLVTVQAAVKVPRNGQKIEGNRVTIVAEVIKGDFPLVKEILFQYRLPSVTGTWLDIPPADEIHPNPDTDSPYFVHWDVTVYPEGPVDLRAVAKDHSDVSDPAPDDITVMIDHNDPETTETLTAEGHTRIDYRMNHGSLADIGLSDEFTSSVYPNTACANIRLRIPCGSLTSGTVVIATFDDPADHPISGVTGESIGYWAVVDDGEKPAKSDPVQPILLRFLYPDNNQDGRVDHTNVLETTLKIYKTNESGDLEEISNIMIDPDTNAISGETNHFSNFTILGRAFPDGNAWTLY